MAPRRGTDGEDLARVRGGIEDLKLSLALHDQKAEGYFQRIAESQERIGDAVVEMSKATTKIGSAVEQIAKNGNGARGIRLDPKTLVWLVSLAVLGALTLGTGDELVRRAFSHFAGPPPVVLEHPKATP